MGVGQTERLRIGKRPRAYRTQSGIVFHSGTAHQAPHDPGEFMLRLQRSDTKSQARFRSDQGRMGRVKFTRRHHHQQIGRDRIPDRLGRIEKTVIGIQQPGELRRMWLKCVAQLLRIKRIGYLAGVN